MIKDILKEKDLTALVIVDPFNMRYVSGFRGGEGILYISNTQNVLITDSRYTTQGKEESDFEVLEENREHNRFVLLEECMKKENIKDFVMGYEDQSMLCCDFHKLQEKLSVTKWVPLGNSIDSLRMIKNDKELADLRKAEEIGDIAFKEILQYIKVGVTEKEIAARLEFIMKSNGADGISFNPIVASGLNSSKPHAIPSDKKLEEGDFITMDFGCTYNGYCSDMTRTIVLGKANEKQKEIYNTVLKAQLAGLKAIKAGVRGKDVDKVARDIIEEAGYGKYFGHGLGHSVGLFIHEEPRLSPAEERVLKPGMLATCEPGIYVPGFGGVRIEDMVAVTEDGMENFAHSPKELIEIEVK